jgi:hypothetical protein
MYPWCILCCSSWTISFFSGGIFPFGYFSIRCYLSEQTQPYRCTILGRYFTQQHVSAVRIIHHQTDVVATSSHHSHNLILKLWIYVNYVRDTLNLIFLTLRFNIFLGLSSPQWAMASLLSRLPDHRCTTLGRTSLDEWSARSRHLYLTTLTTDSHPLGGIQTRNPRKQKTADPRLRRAATGIGRLRGSLR